MKVRVSFTVNVDEEARRLIRHQMGEEGLASRDDVQRFFWGHGDSGWMVLDDQADTDERGAYADRSVG